MMTGTQTTTGRETTAMAETSDVTLPQSRRSWTGRAEPRPAGGRRASCRPRAAAAARHDRDGQQDHAHASRQRRTRTSQGDRADGRDGDAPDVARAPARAPVLPRTGSHHHRRTQQRHDTTRDVHDQHDGADINAAHDTLPSAGSSVAR